MLSKNALFAACCCALICLVTPFLHGQSTSSFSGTVTDNAGAVVAGANVKITSQGTGLTREAKTDDSGHYIIPLLPVSFYAIRVEAQGFAPVEQKDLRLQVDEQRELNFTLRPASVSTSVEVNATEVAVETTTPTLGQVITSEQVSSLPLNGREFVQLATLTPGTTQETNPNSFFNGGPSSEVSARGTFSLSVGGSRAQSTDWILDGNDDNELTAGGIGFNPSIDAIQEFKVLSYNYSAEFGTRAGPTVLVATKSGTNQMHGSLFEFFRNTKLDAADRFVTPGAPKDKFNLNQFGGSLGGALRKDKTFFFMDYQGTRKRRGIVSSGLIPTPDMIGMTKGYGDFTLDALGNPNALPLTNPYSSSPFTCDPSGTPIIPNADGSQTGGTPCNKIPKALIDPTGQAMLELYPTPNVTNTANGFNYLNIPTRSLNDDEFDVKVDHNFSSKDLAYARFSYEQAESLVPGGSPGFAEIGPFSSTQNITNHARNVVISETHIFNERNFNQFTFGFNRIFNHILSFGDRSCEAFKLGLLGANINPVCGDPNAAGVIDQSTKDCLSCGLTSTYVGQYWTLGDRGFAPFLGGTNIFTWADSFDMIRGKHEIRFGGQIRAQQMNVETNGFQDGFILNFGSLTGDGAADLLLGQIGTGSLHDQTFDGAMTGRRWKLFRPYVQDNWRVTNNLTLNLGLAWALVTPITEDQGRQSDFDVITGKYYVAGNSSHRNCTICVPTDGRVGIQMDKTAFEPRIGIAWKPFGNAKTAVRAGYAIYHDSAWNQGAQGLWQNPPYYAEIDNFTGLSPFQKLGTATCGFSVPPNQGCGLRAAFLPVITAQPDPAQFTGTIQSQNFNFKQGRVQQFTLNVEHELPGEVVLTLGYAGSRSHHILLGGVNLNVNSPTACAGGPNAVAGYTFGCGPGGSFVQPPCVNWANPCFPTGGFQLNAFDPIVANISDVGNARYDSLQVKAETKSARHGLYALVGYTWSHTFDSGLPDGLGTSPGATYWPLPGTIRADWGLSALNVADQFTASVLYQLPFGRGKKFGNNWSGATNGILGGWEAQVIERAISGFPLFIVNSANGSGANFQWNGSTLNRPNIVGDPNRPGPVAANPGCAAPSQIHVAGGDWFNPCAFMTTPVGELGDAPRAPVSGPNYINTDFSLIKHIAITERTRLDFRAEFFNLWNHPHLYLPGSPGVSNMQDISAPGSFGIANATVNNLAGDSRVIQFALKLLF
jgi:Carboxypeptidase regulatory-like domain